MKTYDFDAMIFAIVLSVLGGLIVGVFLRGRIGKLKPDGDRTWRTQDWIWLLCFLLYAQVFTVLYKDMVLGVVSYVSTFVSIALGAVAIYISVREATKGDKVKDQINLMIGEMREKLNQMDTKLDSFDSEKFNTVKDIKIDQYTTEIMDKIEQKLASKDSITKQEVIDLVNFQLEQANNDLKSSLNVTQPEVQFDKARVSEYRHGIFKILRKSNRPLSEKEIRLGLSDVQKVVRFSYVLEAIQSMLDLGMIRKTEDDKYTTI